MTRVLVVDDAKFMRVKIREILEAANYIVAGEAADGEEAAALYQRLRPDLVTMDVTMPLKNGIQALQEIMSFDPKANVIMCTAMRQQRIVVEAIELGAKDFIMKPFEESKVLEAVNRVMGK
ncbi:MULTISPECIES: response regulator [Bacillus]|uniref:response regulator n=1 Tax=Bacillus TaxID=1386 RepID=UPI000779DF3E|nr:MULTISPECIES: response regulator [Bacillus]MBT2624104.1 response regulator [Bacillus sp. ISL-32]KAA6452555.1 response regulator [Bacillus atrophaeus]KYD06709.1 hypothetical protein B4144_2087 [Bacillus atrophaeus]MCI3194128.1 response regulator [Bacillus sp. HU-1818]MCY8515791.1 response regulator [Bacillus atrophaeus]